MAQIYYRKPKPGETESVVISAGDILHATRIVGDVQELLPIQDINFETTKAAKIIADSLLK